MSRKASTSSEQPHRATALEGDDASEAEREPPALEDEALERVAGGHWGDPHVTETRSSSRRLIKIIDVSLLGVHVSF